MNHRQQRVFNGVHASTFYRRDRYEALPDTDGDVLIRSLDIEARRHPEDRDPSSLVAAGMRQRRFARGRNA